MTGSATKYNEQINKFEVKDGTYTFSGASLSSDAMKASSLILKRSAMYCSMKNKDDETL
jgi:hypothetical protein